MFNPHIASCAFKQSSRELWSSASCSYSLACVKLSCVSRIAQFDSQAAVHRSQLATQRSCAAIDHSRQRLMHLADCRYMHGCIIIHHVCSRSRALCLSQLSRTLSKLLGASRSSAPSQTSSHVELQHPQRRHGIPRTRNGKSRPSSCSWESSERLLAIALLGDGSAEASHPREIVQSNEVLGSAHSSVHASLRPLVRRFLGDARSEPRDVRAPRMSSSDALPHLQEGRRESDALDFSSLGLVKARDGRGPHRQRRDRRPRGGASHRGPRPREHAREDGGGPRLPHGGQPSAPSTD